jgi:excisionase family DNA binding protein
MAEKKSYTTRELAQMWNVSESTVKRWADIGELKCYRTPGKHRRFTLDSITEFQSTKGFEATGILIGPDREFPDLDTFLNQKKSEKIREALLFLAVNNQASRIRDLFERLHIRGVSLAEIYDEVVLPVLRALDQNLKDQQVSFGQYRVACNNLETGLSYFFPKTVRRRSNGNTALCAAPDSSRVLLVNASVRVLEIEGWECLNLGRNVPFPAMAEMVEKEPVNLVCVNMSSGEVDKLAAEFPCLCQAADHYRIPIVLLGLDLADSTLRNCFVRAEYFPSLRAFRRYVARFKG